MKKNLILETAHLLIESRISIEDVVVDATMGNGHDTLFLANISKFVYAFDIQNIALESTKKMLQHQQINNVKLILDSHEHITSYVKDFKGIIFNLGYLPHTDKSITTTDQTTITALKNVLPHVKLGGFICLVVYTGHQQGMLESLALSHYLTSLDQKLYKVLTIELPYQDNHPPYIVFIDKIKDESF